MLEHVSEHRMKYTQNDAGCLLFTFVVVVLGPLLSLLRQSSPARRRVVGAANRSSEFRGRADKRELIVPSNYRAGRKSSRSTVFQFDRN